MEYTRQELMAWNARAAAVVDYNSCMMKLVFDSLATGTVPVMEPPPPPAGEQPALPTVEEFLAQHCPTPGTGGSSVGGAANYGITPESWSPITPIHRGGGGGDLDGSGAGSGAGSSDDLGFGGLDGDELGGGRPGA